MNKYIKLNIIPIIIEIIFVVSCFIIPKEYFIYTNFLFYMFLLIYFYIKKEFSFKEWLNNIKSGKKFWKQVIITALLFMLAFIITTILEDVFSNYNTGTIGLELTKNQINFVYAEEADVLNMALFGMTAKEWHTKNPNLDGNIRDYATMNELICLANLENLNSVFINEGLKQSERLEKLNKIAISQMQILNDTDIKYLK